MSATQILITLFGEIALLLWGIHMVGAGVQRALGGQLSMVLAVGLRTRWRAFLTGIGVTALLQSSTATALMVSAFSAGGAVELVPALAVMLGANVGTTLIVQLVSFDVSMLFPLLILAGVVTSRSGRRASTREAGGALVGLGIMLLALHLLIETMRPVETSAALATLLEALTQDPVLNVALAALLAWAAHSSVAAMLFIMSIAAAGVISPQASLAMVLGANLGSALNPVFAHLGRDPARLRVPLGNLATRILGCAILLPVLEPVSNFVLSLDASPARAAANFHTSFNLVAALLLIGILPQMARLLERLLPTKAALADPGAPQYLNEAALTTPSLALSNAAREVLRMADVVESMLRGSQHAFLHIDAERAISTSRLDDTLDRLYRSVQSYLGAIGRDALTEEEAQRLSHTLALTINLEHIGDIIDRDLMDLAQKRIRTAIRLPHDAERQIDEMHAILLDHLQLAVAVFMSGDLKAAQRLVAEKEGFRAIERMTTERHFAHVRAGSRRDIEASTLNLDITRDLKRIEGHIAATVHALLERSGQLLNSRLQA